MEHCGECAKFTNEDVNGDGFCSKKDKPMKCSDEACNDIDKEYITADDWLEEIFNSIAFKEEEEKLLLARKKLFSDYRKYRHHSDVPYDYIKEEITGLEYIESVGFFSGFDTTQKYGKTYYILKPEDVKKLNRNESGENLWSWLDFALFTVEDREYEFVSEENGEYYVTKKVKFVEYIAQRCDFEDCYRGFIGLPMTDGRYWMIYYNC